MRLQQAMLVATMSGLAIGCTKSVNIEQERNALLTVDQEASAATTDPNKLLDFYTADASIYPQGMPIATGTEAIKGFLTTALSDPGSSVKWIPSRAEIAASGDIGYTAGTYEATMGGASEKGKYVAVWKKQKDGGWKMTEDIFNADAGMEPPPGEHKMTQNQAVTWGDAPPALPTGAKFAVMSGDPGKPGPFAIRLQFPAGYTVPAHWHPADEGVTVISGTLALGMGDKADATKAESLTAGGYAMLPAKMNHFAIAKTAAVVQINSMGPFAINYVNPDDDPRKQTK